MIWAKLTAQLVGKPYKAGATGPDAYDCLGLLIKTQRKLGWKMPKEWEGYDLTNYAERYAKDPDGSMAALERLLDKHCKPVDSHFLLRGDVVLVRADFNGQIFPAVYAGKRHFLTVILDQKVRVISADSRFYSIIKGWRYAR